MRSCTDCMGFVLITTERLHFHVLSLSEKELNEMKIGNLPNKELKVRLTKMFTELRGSVNKNSKRFKKEL